MNQSEPAAGVAVSERMDRFVTRIRAIPPRVADLALAVVLMLVAINLAATGTPAESSGDTLLLVAGAAALSVRRKWPLAVLAATLVPYVMNPTTAPPLPALLVALYTVATRCSHRTTILATTLAVAASVAAVSIHGGHWSSAASRSVEVAFASLAGVAVVERRRQRERETGMLGQIAAADERARIARELHDVVAHHLSVIVVQANLAAETVAPDHPAYAPTHAVVAEGCDALADTPRVLGVLRTHDGPEERGPQPGLAALGELIERVQAAGLDVSVTAQGEPPRIPPGLDLTAYRIIQAV